MKDIIAVAIVLGFFALCVLYVGWCDRMVGTDDAGLDQIDGTDADRSPATPSHDALHDVAGVNR